VISVLPSANDDTVLSQHLGVPMKKAFEVVEKLDNKAFTIYNTILETSKSRFQSDQATFVLGCFPHE